MWLHMKQWRVEKLLSLADDFMIQNLVVASDSKQAMNDIEKGTNGSYECIISEVKQRMRFFVTAPDQPLFVFVLASMQHV